MHLVEILGNKQKRERHLCDPCHKLEQDNPGDMELLDLISGTIAASAGAVPSPAVDLRCTSCGLAYAKFRGQGRLGCPGCYEAFQEALDPLLEKIHGGRHHVGKTPGTRAVGDRSRERKLVDLRRKLQGAVKAENYEEAARLRDELQKFEGGDENDDDIDDDIDEIAAEIDDLDEEQA